jgi:two-component SAPR family response regulator
MLAVSVIISGSNQKERVSTPGSHELRARARHLFERGEVGEAIELAERAADLAPWEAESWGLLSALHSAAGHPQDAHRIYLWCIVRAAGSGVARCRPPSDLETMR